MLCGTPAVACVAAIRTLTWINIIDSVLVGPVPADAVIPDVAAGYLLLLAKPAAATRIPAIEAIPAVAGFPPFARLLLLLAFHLLIVVFLLLQVLILPVQSVHIGNFLQFFRWPWGV